MELAAAHLDHGAPPSVVVCSAPTLLTSQLAPPSQPCPTFPAPTPILLADLMDCDGVENAKLGSQSR